jgi:hypothetical protein
MTDYIKCECCEWIGTVDDCTPHKTREYDGLDCGPYRYSVYHTCPDCGGEEFFDVNICPACKEAGVIVEADDDDMEFCSEHRSEDDACEAEYKYDAMLDQQMLDADGDAPCVQGEG